MTSIDLIDQCFKICTWIPLTMVKPLLLNIASAYASSVIHKFYKFCGFHLNLRIPLTFCGIHLQLRNPKQLAILAFCEIRNKLNVPTKFTLQVYVRGIHVNLVNGIHLHFGTCLNTCLWNPGTYRHKIVRLSSAQFGLVMIFFIILSNFEWYLRFGCNKCEDVRLVLGMHRRSNKSMTLRLWRRSWRCTWVETTRSSSVLSCPSGKQSSSSFSTSASLELVSDWIIIAF